MSDQHHPDSAPRYGSEERDYLLRRAGDHGRLAEKSDGSASRAIHLRLQQLYTEQARSVVMVLPD